MTFIVIIRRLLQQPNRMGNRIRFKMLSYNDIGLKEGTFSELKTTLC